MYAEYPYILRSVNPCPIAVHMEPLPPRPSKFTFEYLLLPPRSAIHVTSHLLSQYVYQYTKIPSYTLNTNRHTNRLVSVSRFSAIHFRGQSIRQVSCYTFLADFNFHDHRPAVRRNQHPLWYLMSEQLSTLSSH